jgi:hypothetical protein
MRTTQTAEAVRSKGEILNLIGQKFLAADLRGRKPDQKKISFYAPRYLRKSAAKTLAAP